VGKKDKQGFTYFKDVRKISATHAKGNLLFRRYLKFIRYRLATVPGVPVSSTGTLWKMTDGCRKPSDKAEVTVPFGGQPSVMRKKRQCCLENFPEFNY
jgi:hypothetical protein